LRIVGHVTTFRFWWRWEVGRLGIERKQNERETTGARWAPATHLSQVRSVATLTVAGSSAERAADVGPWTEFRDDVGVGDGVGGSLGLAGGDGDVTLGARLDVDCLGVGET
jgi:hypothetical protein